MKEKKFLQSRVLFKQKISLVLFGLFLFFVLLEVSLRLGGFILLSIQECRNLQSIKQKGAYRILCLGESTTQGQYPQFLEKILNQRNIGVRFSVIDKGAFGTNTPIILSKVGSYLDKYHLDMVVAMMGINDKGEYISYEIVNTSKRMFLIRSFRTYKLARLLWLHILTKAKEVGFYALNEDGRFSSDFTRIGLRLVYAESISAESISMEESLKKALELNPKNDNAYVELGRLYREQGKEDQAENSFKKAIELNPGNDNAYAGLVWLYRDHDKLSQAEDLFRKALEFNPKNDNAYVELGRLYREQGKEDQSENSFKKAIELNPKNDNAYAGLGWLYRDQRRLSQTEGLFNYQTLSNPIGKVPLS